MKKFLIKVNGNQYEVEVEEVKENNTVLKQVETVKSAPVAAPAPVAVTAPAPRVDVQGTSMTTPAGATSITSPMPGTILMVNVNAGDTVKKGQVLLILEAMKMENEIVAPKDGKIVSVNVGKDNPVNAGDILAAME